MSTGHLEYGSQNVSLNVSHDFWEYSDIWASVLQEFKNSQVTLTEPSTLALITLYVIIFCMSMTGNILVLLVIVPNRRMSTVTNNFLVNLAVADLLGRIIMSVIQALSIHVLHSLYHKLHHSYLRLCVCPSVRLDLPCPDGDVIMG